MGNDGYKIKKCIIPECQATFDIYQHGQGMRIYCKSHAKIIRKQKQKEYNREYYAKSIQ